MARTHHPSGARRPRIGVVFGAGGVLGAAWMAGALAALQRRLDRPLADVDVLVGTSAGSVLATVLRSGAGVDEIVENQAGGASALPDLTDLDRDLSGGLPPLPRLRIGSPDLVAAAARAPHRIRPWVAATGLLPQGRGRHGPLESLVREVLARYPYNPGRGQLWLMAMDYVSGRRVAFGEDGAPPAELADAVVASCSIPGWFAPRWIGGRPYVDGGVRSVTSLDRLAGLGFDEVYVLAPMASFSTDSPRHPLARAERRVRALFTAALAAEARKVRATGTTVTALTPGPEDLTAIGYNVMDPSRRQQVLETALRTGPRTLAAVQQRRRAA